MARAARRRAATRLSRQARRVEESSSQRSSQLPCFPLSQLLCTQAEIEVEADYSTFIIADVTMKPSKQRVSDHNVRCLVVDTSTAVSWLVDWLGRPGLLEGSLRPSRAPRGKLQGALRLEPPLESHGEVSQKTGCACAFKNQAPHPIPGKSTWLGLHEVRANTTLSGRYDEYCAGHGGPALDLYSIKHSHPPQMCLPGFGCTRSGCQRRNQQQVPQ